MSNTTNTKNNNTGTNYNRGRQHQDLRPGQTTVHVNRPHIISTGPTTIDKKNSKKKCRKKRRKNMQKKKALARDKFKTKVLKVCELEEWN